MQRIEEGAAGERARVCSRPDGKAGLDSGHQSSPVLRPVLVFHMAVCSQCSGRIQGTRFDAFCR